MNKSDLIVSVAATGAVDHNGIAKVAVDAVSDRPPLSPAEAARRLAAAVEESRARAAAEVGAVHQDEALEAAAAIDEQPDEILEASDRSPAAIDWLPRIIREGSPIDVWVSSEDGLRRWRPVIDRVSITQLPNGARLLEVGHAFKIRLDRERSEHLARLLTSDQA